MSASFLQKFATLRWKLALSYVGVTLITALTLEIILFAILGLFGEPIGDFWARNVGLWTAEQMARRSAGPMEYGSAENLAEALYAPTGLILKFGVSGEEDTRFLDDVRVVVDPQGVVVASNRPDRYPAGKQFADEGFPEAEMLVEKALADQRTAAELMKTADVFAAAVPIISSGGEIFGILFYRQPRPAIVHLAPGDLFQPLAATTLVLLPCMIPLGLIFGIVTATGFTRRLKHLTQASVGLAGGNLARRVEDASGDEIGLLSRQFNRMAEEIQAGAGRQRELAALQERQRLARDLHDGIKQNLFGANLAVAAALNLLDSNPEAARTKLLEARDHSRQAGAEMQTLIGELRPALSDPRGLAAALQDYLQTFGKREGIEVVWRATAADFDPPPHCQQALFRIAQELLTNVARHAHAKRVFLELVSGAKEIRMRITDDGAGFDPSAVDPERSTGLRGIRERLAELQGTLAIDSDPGGGTRVTVILPGPASQAQGAAHD
ncbi:MAG: HAMP domain-containing protein [Anaerolineales bacterium]|nr:HAMP domain-containing protein [Anaerolineales bacterium]